MRNLILSLFLIVLCGFISQAIPDNDINLKPEVEFATGFDVGLVADMPCVQALDITYFIHSKTEVIDPETIYKPKLSTREVNSLIIVYSGLPFSITNYLKSNYSPVKDYSEMGYSMKN